MATKITFPGSDTIDFNLIVENRVKYFYRLETWTPIMGALLLSGIVPADYWRSPPERSDNVKGFSFLSQFDELRRRIPEEDQTRLCGLDGEALTASSARFHQVRSVLEHWDYECEDEGKYPSELPPSEFVAWLEEVCWNEDICFFDRIWLDAFQKLHGITSDKVLLPASAVKSFLELSGRSNDSGKHRLGPEIFEAQKRAKSKGENPYAIKVIFPLVFRILDEQGVIKKSHKGYIPGKVLPVELDDSSFYILKRDSLRVYLGRLKDEAHGVTAVA